MDSLALKTIQKAYSKSILRLLSEEKMYCTVQYSTVQCSAVQYSKKMYFFNYRNGFLDPENLEKAISLVKIEALEAVINFENVGHFKVFVEWSKNVQFSLKNQKCSDAINSKTGAMPQQGNMSN